MYTHLQCPQNTESELESVNWGGGSTRFKYGNGIKSVGKCYYIKSGKKHFFHDTSYEQYFFQKFAV